MTKILLNLAVILALITQLLMPNNAMSSEMSESSMQTSSMSHSVMMDNDCDDTDNCCPEDSSHCISHCHAVANAFVLLSDSNLVNDLFTSSKVNSTLWISTPASLGSQNPPPIA
ncbi:MULTISPECIES: hypothetical protein [Shewanella]|jgi:hypothetical protein|uniref:hypothetical protein n=1 Tax=Shewanella TaxID=22 RepID=UPI000CB6EF36|nr:MULTISPECIES: hypothetical protein [Shewanella]MBB1364080.1 hypothetical protein [Shewanella sp. SR44-4]MBB1390194.1 hypothetical protein [Shewanella sp. SG44-6]MBO1897774.1 hypothetical protein [Shewanella sp. BF02_Schw]PIX69795.1 MAG: hypothetical protein COZ42_17580 [Shewanella sp. CG_4_10_14_3_um_filter_42_91]PIY64941.1 MAG: hypothetical protein COY92_14770 [Shewanella sp. CG_4_10_14_0_8_um_filter_42_13]